MEFSNDVLVEDEAFINLLSFKITFWKPIPRTIPNSSVEYLLDDFIDSIIIIAVVKRCLV